MTDTYVSPEQLGTQNTPYDIAAPLMEEPQAARQDHRYFDPRLPEQPEQVLGFNTQHVLRLGSVAVMSQALPYSISSRLYRLPDAVRVMPLLERMQAGETITPEDVRPYRRAIKRLHPGLRRADRALVCASALGIGIPARRALNRRIDEEFPQYAAKVIEQARKTIESGVEAAAPDIDELIKHPNPRAQFEAEVASVARDTRQAIYREQTARIATGKPPELPTPSGFKGLIVRAVRGIRSFFWTIFWT